MAGIRLLADQTRYFVGHSEPQPNSEPSASRRTLFAVEGPTMEDPAAGYADGGEGLHAVESLAGWEMKPARPDTLKGVFSLPTTFKGFLCWGLGD